MGNPFSDAMRDFAVNKLNKECGVEEESMLGVQLFGWDVFRIFRDSDKNMIKIVLKKGNEFREFSHESHS